MPRYSRKSTSRRRTTRTRATASRSRRTNYSARRSPRRATRKVSRRKSAAPRAIKLVIQTAPAPAASVNPLAEPLMKATPSPKKAKF